MFEGEYMCLCCLFFMLYMDFIWLYYFIEVIGRETFAKFVLSEK